MSKPTQTLTKQPDSTLVDDQYIPYSELSPQQQYWVDFCAVQGLIVNDDGSMTKMTVQQCANHLKVARETLYYWKKHIPNFNDLVTDRLQELWGGARTAKVVNAIFLAATVKLNVQAQALWMANQKSIPFRIPQQEVKHELGNSWAGLITKRAKKQAKVIEAEVTDAENPTNN